MCDISADVNAMQDLLRRRNRIMIIDRKCFENTLLRPVESWQGRTKEEVAGLLGESVGLMVGYEQHNPHHCYDLFLHSLHTVGGLSGDIPVLLRTAAFFHDIGKPAAAKCKDGKCVYYGHAAESVKLSIPILKGLGYSCGEADVILFWIGHHDDFTSWTLPEEPVTSPKLVISAQNLLRRMRRVESVESVFSLNERKYLWENLLFLSAADAKAQSDIAIWNGKVIDTKEHKMRKAERILTLIREIDL